MRLATDQRNAANWQQSQQENWEQPSQLHLPPISLPNASTSGTLRSDWTEVYQTDSRYAPSKMPPCPEQDMNHPTSLCNRHSM
jgi:hypothetical protein